MTLPLTLIATLIKAEHRGLSKGLKHGYEDNVVWCDLAKSLSYGPSQLHLYRWDGDAIWYKKGLLESVWVHRYHVITSGDYVVCTGLESSPIVKATFYKEQLQSMYTGPPISCVPELALVYKEEGTGTVTYYDPMDARDPGWPRSVTYPKEYYYYDGVSIDIAYVIRKVKEEYEAKRKANNIKLTVEAVVKVLGKGDYRWNSYSNTIIERVLVSTEREYCYDSDGYQDYYDRDKYEDRTLFTVTTAEVETGTKIVLTGTDRCRVSTITLLDEVNPDLNTQSVVVWKDKDAVSADITPM